MRENIDKEPNVFWIDQLVFISIFAGINILFHALDKYYEIATKYCLIFSVAASLGLSRKTPIRACLTGMDPLGGGTSNERHPFSRNTGYAASACV